MIEGAGDTYLDYRVRWRSGDARPGRHLSGRSGQGGDFRAHRPFWQLPDAARIDIRRSMLDPAQQLLVRQTDQRSAITLAVAADLSRSLQAPSPRRLHCVVRLAAAAARAALRAGDSFAFFAFDETLRSDLTLPPTRARAAARRLLEDLGQADPRGRSAEGLLDLAMQLPAKRCLLLLISDFLLPAGMLEAGLQSLAGHDVVPVLLHAPVMPPPRTGLWRLRDSETGVSRLLWMRPSLHRKWQAAEAARLKTRDALFARFCRPAIEVHGALDVARISEQLMAA